MGDLDTVFHTITNAGENKVTAFCESLVDIYAHAKTEIVEFTEKLDNAILVRLRDILFTKLQEILPHLKGYELYARRSKALLVEDVYIIGFSLVSKIEDKRIKKNVIKGTIANESLSQEDITTDLLENKDLFTVCADLKSSVDIFRIRIKQLEDRVIELENEVTRSKMEKINSENNQEKDEEPLVQDVSNGTLTELN